MLFTSSSTLISHNRPEKPLLHLKIATHTYTSFIMTYRNATLDSHLVYALWATLGSSVNCFPKFKRIVVWGCER